MNSSRFARALGALGLAAAFALGVVPASSPAATGSAPLLTGRLIDGSRVTVSRDGVAQVVRTKRSVTTVERRAVAGIANLLRTDASRADRLAVLAQLDEAPYRPYAPDRVNVIFRGGVTIPRDVVTVPLHALATRVTLPASRAMQAALPYSTDAATNAVLTALGVDRTTRVMRSIARARLSAMAQRAAAATHAPLVDIGNAFTLHLTHASVRDAVRRLAKLPSVAFVEPDWTVSTMHTAPIRLSQDDLRRASSEVPAMKATAGLPANFAITSSAQSLLNASGIDDVAAYDEIERRFHELPGTGEIVTNVSLGDVDDARAAADPSDPCNAWVKDYGPTTDVIGGRRYLDWPSMPLIPAYTANAGGSIAPGDACGLDPSLAEVGLDFSMMAPLPHDRQRSNELGSGFTDLLGIAPGARYRLVVPQPNADGSVTSSNISAAFMAAASQSPAPSVITASLGWGYDDLGFPGRYLEEDPLILGTISALVNAANIVVCIAANDGLRTYTNAAVNPNGGSAPTELAASLADTTDLNDDYLSTMPSRVLDSGAIDVGGTTLDDIIAANPLDPANARLASQHAFPETRWDGFTSFSSGYGPRVNVSAPSDNVLAMQRALGGNYDTVETVLAGGTSAAAPETAAAAAVALQVARLTGHPFKSARDVRSFLIDTASAVPNLPQTGGAVSVGPQIDLRRAVEKLFAAGDVAIAPRVVRFAVAQRKNAPYYCEDGDLDSTIVEDTDPSEIDLQGLQNGGCGYNVNFNAYITIAPDWEGIPANARYRLYVAGHPGQVLATGAYARLLPLQILQAAHATIDSSLRRSVALTYQAYRGMHAYAQGTVDLTFSPSDRRSMKVLAPIVPPRVTGTTIPVRYDVSHFSGSTQTPLLVVSYPGRVNPSTGHRFTPPLYVRRLTEPRGTVRVPVSALKGAGIYGIGIALVYPDGTPGEAGASEDQFYSDFAYTEVAPGVDAQPNAPLVGQLGALYHGATLAFGTTSFRVRYDVSNVPGANGATIEFGAPGPTYYGSYDAVDNPNGDRVDNDGKDAPAVADVPVSGTRGTATITTGQAKLLGGDYQTVRVIPTKNGTPIGAASDVSTVNLAGIAAPNGISLGSGIYGAAAINPAGNDGIIAAGGVSLETLSGFSDLYAFNQTTGAVAPIAPSLPVSLLTGPVTLYTLFGGGAFAPDTGIAVNDNLIGSTTIGAYASLQTATAATTPETWPLPALPNGATLFEVAPSGTATQSAMLAFAQGAEKIYAFTANLDTGATGTIVDASGPPAAILPPTGAYRSFAPISFDYDPTRNKGYFTAEIEGPNLESTPACELFAIDFATGTTTDVGHAGVYCTDLQVDPVTDKAFIAALIPATMGSQAQAGVVIADLQSGSIATATIPGTTQNLPPSGAYDTGNLAVDSTHGLVLLEVASRNAAVDNNATGQILVLDESGNIQAALPGVALQSIVVAGNHALQVNPSTRKAFFETPIGGVVQAFAY